MLKWSSFEKELYGLYNNNIWSAYVTSLYTCA
jgi:hypothetical protein